MNDDNLIILVDFDEPGMAEVSLEFPPRSKTPVLECNINLRFQTDDLRLGLRRA
jgi:hypothetical protein